MFRKLVKTGEIEIDDRKYVVRILRAADGARGASVQLRGAARGSGPHHRGRRLGDEPRVEGRQAGPGDDLQPAARRPPDRRRRRVRQ